MKYVISKGDTLSQIARKFGMDMKKLAAANNIKNPDKIYLGQELSIPEESRKIDAAQVQREMSKKRRGPRRKSTEKEPRREITFSLFPKAAAAEKPTPRSLMEPPKEERKAEPLIPTNIRQLFFDVFGGDSTVTEDNLKSKEIEALKSAVTSARKRGSSAIEYEDYQTQAEDESQYADVGGGGSMLGKIADPAYSMKTFIGQGGITKNDKGETIVLDRYNFNDAVDGNLLDYLKDVRKAGLSFYDQARAVGRHFGSAPGEGSPVAINLGMI